MVENIYIYKAKGDLGLLFLMLISLSGDFLSSRGPSKQAVPSYNESRYTHFSPRLWTFLATSHGINLYHPSQLTIIYHLIQKTTPKTLNKEPKTVF